MRITNVTIIFSIGFIAFFFLGIFPTLHYFIYSDEGFFTGNWGELRIISLVTWAIVIAIFISALINDEITVDYFIRFPWQKSEYQKAIDNLYVELGKASVKQDNEKVDKILDQIERFESLISHK